MSTEIHYKTFEEYFYESEAKNRKLQSRIKELEDAVSELGKGLRFYGDVVDHKNYAVAFCQARIIENDLADFSHGGITVKVSGKKAREIVTKHKDLIESITKG